VDLLASLISLSFLAAIVRHALPLSLAATGGMLSERSGVIQIALEGLMVSGAFAGACGAYYGGGALAGIAAGVAVGALLGLAYAWIVVKLEADQIVTGVALNLLAEGLTRYLLKVVFGSAANSKDLDQVSALWSSWTVGDLLANPLVWICILAAVGVHLALSRSRAGLRLRAAGDHPAAAEALGVDVAQVRLGAVALAGALAGLAGVWMVLALRSYSSGIIGGRGYIALAAVIFGAWRPLPVLGATVLFGLFKALEVELRTSPSVLEVIPAGYIMTLPYVMPVLALVLWSRRGRSRTTAPRALGRPLSEGHSAR